MMSYPPGSSIYYAMMFENEMVKDALAPLTAFAQTIMKITREYKTADIAKIKLQWWQNEIIHLYQAKPSHPITQALLPVLQRYAIPQQLLHDYLDGALLKIDTDHFCTRDDFKLFSFREYGLMLTACCYILTGTAPTDIKIITALAYSLTLCDQIIHIRDYKQHGKQLFTLADLQPFANLPEISDTQQMHLLHLYAQLAQDNFISALKKLSKVEQRQLRPLLIYIYLNLSLLQEMMRAGLQIYTCKYRLTPLRKWWLAWWFKIRNRL